MKRPGQISVNIATVAIVAAAVIVVLSCDTQASGTDSSTHWLSPCRGKGDCGSLDCICGACPNRCTATASCKGRSPVARCAPFGAPGCAEASKVCVATCTTESDCHAIASGLGCVNGQCAPRGSDASFGSGGARGDGGAE